MIVIDFVLRFVIQLHTLKFIFVMNPVVFIHSSVVKAVEGRCQGTPLTGHQSVTGPHIQTYVKFKLTPWIQSLHMT